MQTPSMKKTVNRKEVTILSTTHNVRSSMQTPSMKKTVNRNEVTILSTTECGQLRALIPCHMSSNKLTYMNKKPAKKTAI
mgnify:CR=1 FL=1